MKSFTKLTLIIGMTIASINMANAALLSDSQVKVTTAQDSTHIDYNSNHVVLVSVTAPDGTPCIVTMGDDYRSGVSTQCDFSHKNKPVK